MMARQVASDTAELTEWQLPSAINTFIDWCGVAVLKREAIQFSGAGLVWKMVVT